jgi:NADH dehydrogenase
LLPWRVSPVLPLIGGGRTKLQPVYACEVAAAIAAACAGKARPHTIYELGGGAEGSARR